jgi:hypothetical protein
MRRSVHRCTNQTRPPSAKATRSCTKPVHKSSGHRTNRPNHRPLYRAAENVFPTATMPRRLNPAPGRS